MMHIHRDFEEFLQYLNDNEVKYVIVGGYAVAFHGYTRATSDMDLFFENTESNIQKICKALALFGITTNEQSVKDFSDPGSIIRLGIPPVQLEMINLISGLTFTEVWDHRVGGKYGEIPVFYISFADLLKNKKASGRIKDLADFDELGGNRG